MEAKRDGLYLMIAIFDEFGERGAFGAGGIRKRDDRALLFKWRECEGQVFDHLAPDIENIGAGGFALEIFLRGPLVDLPGKKGRGDAARIDHPHDEEMG